MSLKTNYEKKFLIRFINSSVFFSIITLTLEISLNAWSHTKIKQES
jgi:hypothetical protein